MTTCTTTVIHTTFMSWPAKEIAYTVVKVSVSISFCLCPFKYYFKYLIVYYFTSINIWGPIYEYKKAKMHSVVLTFQNTSLLCIFVLIIFISHTDYKKNL